MLSELNTRVDILVKDSTQDACGGLSSALLLLYPNLWANVQDLNGKEVNVAGQLASDVEVKVTVRVRSAITSACLVRWNGIVYTIRYMKDPASATVAQSDTGSVSRRRPRLFRNTYVELYCSRFNDQSAAAATLQHAHAVPDHP